MWTLKDIETLKTNHGKLTLPQINKLLDTPKSYTCLRSYAQRLGLFRNKTNIRLPIKNRYNMNYWDKPNLINSTLAGRIAGDGCLREVSPGHFSFSYKCAIKDECIIDNFIKELKYTGKKCYTQGVSPHYPERICKMVDIQLSSFDNNAQNLNKWYNITSVKTHRLGPTNIQDDNLNLAFCIGLLDSDGSIEVRDNGKYGLEVRFAYFSCSEKIVIWYKDLVDRLFPSYTDRVANLVKQDTLYRLYIGGVRAAVIIDYLSQFPVPKLDRKWTPPKLWECINIIKTKNPHLFKKLVLPPNLSVNPIEEKTLETSLISPIIS